MIVDASVWTSYFIPTDRFHAETVAWLEDSVSGGDPLSAPLLLLPELAGAVARRSGDSEAGAEAARQLLSWPTLSLVSLTEELMMEAAQMASSLLVRGADAIYIATARTLGVTLVTWDREQKARGSTVVASLSPADFL